MKIAKLILLGALLPLSSYAADLTFTNNTDVNATGIINGGFCSSQFGDQGIIHAHNSITIYKQQLELACGLNTIRCVTDLYMSNDCTGPKVGTIVVSVENGVISADSTSDSYKISSDDTQHVQIDPATMKF